MLQPLETRAVQPCETKDDREFVDRHLRSFGEISLTVESIYRKLCESPGEAARRLCLVRLSEVAQRARENDCYSGNVFLRCLKPLVQTSTSDIAFFRRVPRLCYAESEDLFREYAEELARICQVEISFPKREYESEVEKLELVRLRVCKVIREYGLSVEMEQVDNWDACVVEPDFWFKEIKHESKRRIEQVLRELGKVSKHRGAGCYVSDFTFRRFKSNQRQSQHALSLMEAVNDLGETFTLDELAKRGVSNPALRRIEWMLRLRGMEEWAENDSEEWIAAFYTITLPSRFHVYSGAGINPVYDGSTPSDARDQLQFLWENARKRLHEYGVQYFGGRVAEPHHDGCPHWHMLLFVPKSQEALLTTQLRKMAFSESPDEPGAAKHRFTVEYIDKRKGSAVGYIAKYIAKNIDGYEVGVDDESGQNASESAHRVRAWASTWGIRQFQQIGGPPVTPWREVRRLSAKDILRFDKEIRELLNPIFEAADSADWAAYMRAMGGAICKRCDRPVSTWMAMVLTQDKSRERPAIRGIVLNSIGQNVLTRLRDWVIRRKDRGINLAVSRYGAQGARAPALGLV